MSCSIIDFSAQFGGRDASTAVLPHFKALKAAAHGIHLEGFPFPKLAYILRVDGELNQYGLSGSGNLDIDKDGEYLSVDIGIEREDRDQIPDVIIAAILSSVEQIRTIRNSRTLDVDFAALQRCLDDLSVRYRNELDRPGPI
jgi:hypothetical protein